MQGSLRNTCAVALFCGLIGAAFPADAAQTTTATANSASTAPASISDCSPATVTIGLPSGCPQGGNPAAEQAVTANLNRQSVQSGLAQNAAGDQQAGTAASPGTVAGNPPAASGQSVVRGGGRKRAGVAALPRSQRVARGGGAKRIRNR